VVRINDDRLVRASVVGEVMPIRGSPYTYQITHNGEPVVLPSVGGIVYNVKVGDRAVGWEADHLEPCVSTKNRDKDDNVGYNLYSCIGNRVRVISGDAKGAQGVVTGKHGGIEHVIVDFADDVLRKLCVGDKVLVEAWGLGLKLLDHPEVKVMNIDPTLLLRLLKERKGGGLRIGVTHLVPARIMGSGLGASHTYRGDYDVQLFDKETVKKHSLESLRFGDIVAITDADHSFGRIYKKGAVSVGVVVHSDCVISGHGPGITTILTSSSGEIETYIDKNANIGYHLKIGKWRRKKGKKKR